MSLLLSLPLAVAAAVVEALIGYPAPLYRAIGHPVTWMGFWLAWLDARFNRAEAGFAVRRVAGVLALCFYLAPVGLIAWAATRVCVSTGVFGFAALALLAASLPAQRSLARHVAAVADGLDMSLDEGRRAVAQIVGRNPNALDEAGVARAAIESLAENFSDGVVAPILWTALGGLAGGALYKAINTADSMIGHKDERHAAFGWAAARLDDLVNLPASRLAALWLILAAATIPRASAREAAHAVRRDASHHRSPNAGWPEAAMAGALGLKLAGPRVYGETLVEDAFMGERQARGGRRRHPAGAAALHASVCDPGGDAPGDVGYSIGGKRHHGERVDMRWFARAVMALSVAGLMISEADARIARIEITKTEPAFGGQSFGDIGPYERVVGRVIGELDPADPANSGIQDINLAPRNGRGMVEYVTDIEFLKPVELARGNRILFFEVNNRGNKLALGAFNEGVGGGVANRNALSSPGDGWLMRSGYTMVWFGWEMDVRPGMSRVGMAPIVAHNHDGSAITGTVRSEIITPVAATSLPIVLSQQIQNYPIDSYDSYPTASTDNSTPFADGFLPTLTVRAREQDPREPIPNAAWSFGTCEHGARCDAR